MAVAWGSAASAQDAPATPQEIPAEPNQVQDGSDIIVTAQRREETLQRTPVSVAVLTADALTDQAVTTQSDLAIALPGLSVRASADSNQLNFAIRGQSLDAFSATRPGVLPYFNEVQISGPGGASAFYDLQSVQVLKGPQGTLFGRNATGGAVLFTTARPSNDIEGYGLARVGNYNAFQVEGAINLPIVDDTLLVRIAGVHQSRHGFQTNDHPFCAAPRPLFAHPNDPVSPDRSNDNSCRIGDVERTGGRFSLTIRPSASIRNDFVFDYLKSGGSGTSGVLYSLNPNGAIPGLALTNSSAAGAPTMEAIISGFVTGAGGPPNLGVGAAAAYRAAGPHLPEGGLAAFLPIQQARGPFKVSIDGLNAYRARNILISNVTEIDIAANATIKNVFGYTDVKSTTFSDIDGSPFGIDNNGFYRNSLDGPNGRVDETRQYSNELQILGETLEERLSYVAGIYYANERNFNLTTSDLFDFPIIRTLQFNNTISRNETYAGYAQGTYDLGSAVAEGLSFTAGLRYTKEDISLQTLPRDVANNDPPAVLATYDFTQSQSFDTVSWTLGLQYQVTPDTLFYAANRRSYRHGGFNNVVRPVPGLGTDGGNAYGLETVTDVELGIKTQGRIGLPYRLNIAVYQNWIQDAQRVAYALSAGSPAAITVNVPKAIVRGFEIDGQISPTDWINIGGQVNYTDAKFTDNLVSILGAAPVEFGTYPDVPKWSGAAYVDVNVPLTARLSLQARGDVYSQSSFSFSSTGNLNPGTRLPGYELVNLRLGVTDDQSGLSFAGIVRNVFDQVYYVGGVALGELFQSNSAVPGEPRTFVIEAKFKF